MTPGWSRDGHVTEGTSNNAYIVKGNTIVTRHLGTEILHGITRAAVLRFAREAQMTVEERPFTVEEAKAADEAFITSASSFVMPVVEMDGQAIGNRQAGPCDRPPARDLPRRDAQGGGLIRRPGHAARQGAVASSGRNSAVIDALSATVIP